MIDFSSAKKIAQNRHGSTFELANGHRLTVAHKGLSEIHRRLIKRLPLYKASGGVIEEPTIPDEPETEPTPVLTSGRQAMAEGGKTREVPVDTEGAEPVNEGDIQSMTGPGAVEPGSIPAAVAETADARQQAENLGLSNTPLTDQALEARTPYTSAVSDYIQDNPSSSSTPSAPSAQPPQADQEQPAQRDPLAGTDLGSIYKEGEAGIQARAKAEQSAAQARADLELQHQTALQDAQTAWNGRTTAMLKDQDAVLADIKAGHINPSHYQQSMGTGQKIATAIGLLLGGVASGHTGNNPALEFMNKQIDRDIDAQKADLNNKHTLFQAYNQQYHNATVAEELTRATLKNVYASQIDEAGAKAQIPMAKANAQIASTAFKQQILPSILKAQLLHAASPFTGPSGTGTGQAGSEAQFQTTLQAAQNIDPNIYKDLESKYIPGVGVTRVPLEKGKDGEMFAELKLLNGLAQQAEAIAGDKRNGGTAYNPFGAYAQHTANIANNIRLSYNKLVGLNRINPYEAEKFDKLVRDPGSWQSSRAVQSARDLQSFIKEKTATEFRRLGVQPFSRGQ